MIASPWVDPSLTHRPNSVTPSCWRAGFLRASLTEERADLSRYPRVFLVLAVVGDEVAEYSAALEPFLRETPALARGCLPRFLLGEQAGTGFCLLPLLTLTGLCRELLLTLALFLGLARGLGLQQAAFGGEPLLLGSARLPLGLFPGKLLGPLTLEALALGALRGFLPGPGLPLFFCGHGAALGRADVAAPQVAGAGGIDRSAAVLLADLARRIHRRRGGPLLQAAAACREHEEQDDGYMFLHG